MKIVNLLVFRLSACFNGFVYNVYVFSPFFALLLFMQFFFCFNALFFFYCHLVCLFSSWLCMVYSVFNKLVFLILCSDCFCLMKVLCAH